MPNSPWVHARASAHPFRVWSNEALAWWVWHIQNDGCDLCPDTTPADVAAMVLAEADRRGGVGLPRHLMGRGRH